MIIILQERILFTYLDLNSLTSIHDPGGTFILGGRGGLAPKFASEIIVGAPILSPKIWVTKYPKFYPLNFRYDPKIGNFPQLLRLVVTELPKFFLLFGELGWTLPQILPPNLI